MSESVVNLRPSKFAEVIGMAVVNEMRHYLLWLQLRRLRMRAASTSRSRAFRLRVAMMVVFSSALVCGTQQYRIAGSLLLLGLWDGLVGLPTRFTVPEGDKHQMLAPARLAHCFASAQLRDMTQVMVVAACLSTASIAYSNGWWGGTPAASSSVLAVLVTKAVMATTAFSALYDFGILALNRLYAPAIAAVQNGCLRSRLLMHMCIWERHVDGDEGAFAEQLAGQTAALEWRVTWVTAELHRNALRRMLCDRVITLMEALRIAINAKLMQCVLTHAAMDNNLRAQQQQQREETPEAGEERCVQWLRSHGARVEAAWWGTEDELCTICLCGLGETSVSGSGGTKDVASFPCCANHAHVFHAKCLCGWLARHTDEDAMTCPLCRSGPVS